MGNIMTPCVAILIFREAVMIVNLWRLLLQLGPGNSLLRPFRGHRRVTTSESMRSSFALFSSSLYAWQFSSEEGGSGFAILRSQGVDKYKGPYFYREILFSKKFSDFQNFRRHRKYTIALQSHKFIVKLDKFLLNKIFPQKHGISALSTLFPIGP